VFRHDHASPTGRSRGYCTFCIATLRFSGRTTIFDRSHDIVHVRALFSHQPLPKIVDGLGALPVQIYEAALAKPFRCADSRRPTSSASRVVFLGDIVYPAFAQHAQYAIQADTCGFGHFLGIQVRLTGKHVLDFAEVNIFLRLAKVANLGHNLVEELVAPGAFCESKIQVFSLLKTLPKYTTSNRLLARLIF